MSAVTLLSSLMERPSDDSLNDGPAPEGEEHGAGGGGDPAVLAVGPARQTLVYSRDTLLRLRNSPLCKRALDAALRGSDAMALVLKKRSDSPNDEDRGARGDAPNENHKGVFTRERRSADPRERVRKESEPSSGGIVLSPQRRSFTSGCGAPAAAAAPPPALQRTRPESPAAAAAAALHPKPDTAGRRIGSGRLMLRGDVTSAPWERGPQDERDRDREAERERDREPYRPPAHKQSDRFERRSFGRDSYSSDIKREREERFNNDKLQHRDENRRGRFNQRRFDKDEEPEWFSAGPTSKLDTIELRGFEEPPPTKQRNGNANNNETDKWNKNDSGPRSPAASPPPSAHSDDTQDTSNDLDSGVESKTGEEAPPSAEQPDFNIDDFLKFDLEADVLTNGGADAEGGSRFSRWFRRESPTNEHNRHYERLLHNMVDELESSAPAPGPAPGGGGGGSHVFAPISPAPAPAPAARAPSLLDLLRRANQDDRPAEMSAGVSAGRIHSLEELEARLRPPPPPPHPHPHPPHHLPDHDLSAFKRLLAQVSGGHAVPATVESARAPPPQQPPMSLLQMLSKSMEQQQQAKPQQPHIPQELLYKLLQVQQRQQQPPEMPPAAPHAPPMPDRELLQRPEAQAIIHGLKAGEITVQHLVQQLNNPGLQSRHRELLLTILRMHHHHTQQMSGGSPLPAPAPHLVLPPHHQPLRLSPVPIPAFSVSPIMPMATSPNTLSVHHPGVPARIPSPRELAAHTQSIMQGALIKKKLEEQRENYRRRHEMSQPKQPTPISFTPTSVLRKMTAEKESDAPSPKQLWSQPPKMPQGRPIVKGNQGGAPAMGYSPAEYHYINQQQQQMASNIRPFPHQQPRQMPQSLGSMGGLARGVAGGATLQQLLLQSHQRTLNAGDWPIDMSGGPAGGDNQLARWFSPELLARASAGKLPSLRVPNALSLEDLERHHSPAVRN